MKKILLPLIFSLTAPYIYAQEETYVDLYAVKDFSTQTLWSNPYYNSANAWKTTDGTLTKPSTNNDLWIIANTNIDTGLVSGYQSTPINIHDLNFDLTLSCVKNSETSYTYPTFNLIGSANASMNINGDFNVTVRKANSYWNAQKLAIILGGDLIGGGSTNESGSTYHVFGDMVVTNQAAADEYSAQGIELKIANGMQMQNVSPWAVTKIQKNCTYQVDGDLVLKQTAGYTESADLNNQRIVFKTNLTNFIVGGVVDMTALYKSTVNHDTLTEWDMRFKSGTKADTFDASTMFDSNITIGGLKGTATLLASEDFDAANYKINMKFTNKTSATWQGKFKNSGGTLFHILMDESTTGEQTMIFESASTTASSTGYLVDSVTVSGGKLNFQNMSTTFGNGKLVLNGGKFAALGDGVKFANAQLSSGELLIAKDSFSAGIFALELGELSKSGNEQIGINFDGFDASDIIGDPSYSLIFADSLSGFDADANNDFIATNLAGALASFAWNGNTLTVTFNNVPEPATVAVIFGAIGLAFAAYRRRK